VFKKCLWLFAVTDALISRLRADKESAESQVRIQWYFFTHTAGCVPVIFVNIYFWYVAKLDITANHDFVSKKHKMCQNWYTHLVSLGCSLQVNSPIKKTVTWHMGSHSVTCHLTQVNTLRHISSQTGWHSICLPQKDGKLSWPRYLVMYWNNLPMTVGHKSDTLMP